MATFEQLKKKVLEQAKVPTHFAFRDLGPEYNAYWDELNAVEFKRGYVPGEYEKIGTPGLCEMNLLTEAEFTEWLERLSTILNKNKSRS